MRAVVMGFVVIFIFSSSTLSQNNKLSNSGKVNFGDISINLPQIKGFVQVYNEPKFKEIIDKTNYPSNSILGYYVPSGFYEKFKKDAECSLDGYFQLFATNAAKGKQINQSDLKIFAEQMSKQFAKENWSDLKNKFNNNYGLLNLSPGRPILIDNYSPHNQVESNVILMKIIDKEMGDEYIQISIQNNILLKNRLVWLGYYVKYDGNESINKAKLDNQSVIKKLLDINQ